MKNLATITIKDIAVDCILGVGDKEREKKQTVLVTVTITIDATKASKTDAIADSVSYSPLFKNIVALVSQSEFHLLEALASAILTMCLEDKNILKAIVSVGKPHVYPQAKGVFLEMSGTNE